MGGYVNMGDNIDTIVFTPSALMELLASIEELKDKDIGITETIDGKLQLQIGESVYEVESKSDEVVNVPDDVVEKIEDINQESYENMSDNLGEDVEVQQDHVEGGIIKELAKSLLLGGMIRLSGKLLK